MRSWRSPENIKATAVGATSWRRVIVMKVPAIVRCALLCSLSLRAQIPINGLFPGGGRQLLSSDTAVLNTRDKKMSLPCEVKPVEPRLGFDLGFHTGYKVRIRFHDLADGGDILEVIFRVTHENNTIWPAYFKQEWKLPPISDDSFGAVSLDGAFTVGTGNYKVDWLMRDGMERVCSAHWKISIRLPAAEEHPAIALEAGSVIASGEFTHEKRSAPGSGGRPAVTILAHVGSQRRRAAALVPEEKQTLLSILQGISREPCIGSFSLVGFNLDHRKVLFKQDNVKQIDLAALDRAVSSFYPGTVALSQLAEKTTRSDFLVQLAAEQVQRNQPDALIFVSPKIADYPRSEDRMLDGLGEISCPVFYLSYNPGWAAKGGTDWIAAAVRHWKGYEFNLRKPVDLLSVWSNIMSRIGQGTAWQSVSRPR